MVMVSNHTTNLPIRVSTMVLAMQHSSSSPHITKVLAAIIRIAFIIKVLIGNSLSNSRINSSSITPTMECKTAVSNQPSIAALKIQVSLILRFSLLNRIIQ